jgi:hypothetical protein
VGARFFVAAAQSDPFKKLQEAYCKKKGLNLSEYVA